MLYPSFGKRRFCFPEAQTIRGPAAERRSQTRRNPRRKSRFPPSQPPSLSKRQQRHGEMKKFRKVLDGLTTSSPGGTVGSPSCGSAAGTPTAAPTPKEIDIQETLVSENFQLCKVGGQKQTRAPYGWLHWDLCVKDLCVKVELGASLAAASGGLIVEKVGQLFVSCSH